MLRELGIIGAGGVIGKTLAGVIERDPFFAESGHLRLKKFGRDSEIPDLDIVFLCTDSPESVSFYEKLKNRTGFIIDLSSAFRMDKNVPLVIPEINASDINHHTRLIASPNCTTSGLVLTLHYLKPLTDFTEVTVCSYQALSGGGQRLIEEANREDSIHYRNCVPHIGKIDENGYCEEELKLMNETRKILHADSLAVSANVARVPVVNGHSMYASVKTRVRVDLKSVEVAWSEGEGLFYNGEIHTPKRCSGRDEVFVSRLRRDLFNENRIHYWITFDNLLKGGALNAWQIAKHILREVRS